MAQVIGNLRDDKATHGERQVLKLLRQNLPKEYNVYVECPLPGERRHRYPDFVVATNYGVIVLEVKDWIQIESADRYNARIRMRNNQVRKVKNPVDQAHKIALSLAEDLRQIKDKFRDQGQQEIPWGYAAIFPNLPTSVITQLRSVWGDEFVLNTDDLDAPLILDRIKRTLPKDRVRDLHKYEMDFIRATINPSVVIEPVGRAALILDEEQEQIVVEPVKSEVAPEKPARPAVEQQSLFQEPVPGIDEPIEQIQQDEDALSKNIAIRLVRGVAGSGKSLVLTQRARYLAAQYPEWNILVLTYNRELQKHLQATLKGFSNLKVRTFHNICKLLLSCARSWREPCNPDGWVNRHRSTYPIVRELGADFVAGEITWIKEMGIPDLEAYLATERKGRGTETRMTQSRRAQVYAVLEGYQDFLDAEEALDWADIPHMVLQGLHSGAIAQPLYDAVLIDEAQDFAPVWVRVARGLLKPEGGYIFLADDPAQSIYRFYSWREKGVPVVGRTRWLRVPYRNTYEIYQAAYQIIATDEALQKSLQEEGLLVEPDLNAAMLRHGERPLVQRFRSFDLEAEYIRERVAYLLQQGVDERQIAVLHRHQNGVRRLKDALKGYNISVGTLHAYKGLEFDTVFLSQIQETSVPKNQVERSAQERRLVYMAMTRARERLYLGYTGKLPGKFNALREYADFVA